MARRLKLSVVQVDLSSSEDEVDDDGDSPQSQSAGDIGSAVLSSTPPPSQAPSPVSATLVTDDDRCKLMDAAADRSDDSDCESGEGGKAAVPLPPLSLRQGFRVIFRDHPTVMVMLLFCVNSFCNGGILLCDVLFMALPVAHLGLGFSPATIGVANSVFGVFAPSFQMFAVKPLLRRLSPLQAYRRIGTVSLGIGSALLPIAALPLAATRCIVPEGPNVTAVSALARAASFAHAGGVHGVAQLGYRVFGACLPSDRLHDVPAHGAHVHEQRSVRGNPRIDPRHRIIVRRSSARNRPYGDRCCVLCDCFGAPTVLG